MQLKIKIIPYVLQFKNAAGTSRGVLREKKTWFVKVFDSSAPYDFGLGEINMFQGLSFDDRPDFYNMLDWIQNNPAHFCEESDLKKLADFPAVRFGLETALLDYRNQKNRLLFPSLFTENKKGIPINGLIWMGDKEFMLKQIRDKMDNGFRCLKMKIGAIDFSSELAVLKAIRTRFSGQDLELRVDANGAFEIKNALVKIAELAKFNIHSIEQPIKQGHWKHMNNLCAKTTIPIALDEELIGVNEMKKRTQLLEEIQPQYIILKPALVGGFLASEKWIALANERNISWWITSALESNIGLSAIAQWTFNLQTNNYQGLGTGQLYTNNIESPLVVKGERLFYDPHKSWGLSDI